MRTSIDIPDELFRKAKVRAAEKGLTLKDLIVSGLSKEIEVSTENREAVWGQFFGAFKDNPEVIDELDRVIEEEFGQIDPEDWK